MDTPSNLLTPRQAAKLLHTTASTVRDWIASGKLPASRPGGRWLIRRVDVDALLVAVPVQQRPQTSTERANRQTWVDVVLRDAGVID